MQITNRSHVFEAGGSEFYSPTNQIQCKTPTDINTLQLFINHEMSDAILRKNAHFSVKKYIIKMQTNNCISILALAFHIMKINFFCHLIDKYYTQFKNVAAQFFDYIMYQFIKRFKKYLFSNACSSS